MITYHPVVSPREFAASDKPSAVEIAAMAQALGVLGLSGTPFFVGIPFVISCTPSPKIRRMLGEVASAMSEGFPMLSQLHRHQDFLGKDFLEAVQEGERDESDETLASSLMQYARNKALPANYVSKQLGRSPGLQVFTESMARNLEGKPFFCEAMELSLAEAGQSFAATMQGFKKDLRRHQRIWLAAFKHRELFDPLYLPALKAGDISGGSRFPQIFKLLAKL